MNTAEGDQVNPGDPVLIRGTYLGPPSFRGVVRDPKQAVIGFGMIDTAIVPGRAVEVPPEAEPATWRLVTKAMGIGGVDRLDFYHVGLYRRTNTGDWYLNYLWGGPDEEVLSALMTIVHLLGAEVASRDDLVERDHEPLPQWLYGDDMEDRA